jgi:hypothetical protein
MRTAVNYRCAIIVEFGRASGYVICSTGLGQLADMEPANVLMRTAVNYRCGLDVHTNIT